MFLGVKWKQFPVSLCICVSTYIILTFFRSADYVFSTEDTLVF